MLLAAAAFTAAMVWKPAPPARFVGLASAEVPARVGPFLSHGDREPARDVRVALGAASLLFRDYADMQGNLIDFSLIAGTDRSALHDPRSCMVGSGWRLENDRTEPLPGTNLMMRSCRLVGGDSGRAVPLDVLYVYVVDGRIVNQVTQIRTQMLWSALIGRKHRPVYFLRFVQPVTAPANAAADHARLQSFAGDMWRALAPRLAPAGVRG
jgi:uncharacterized protein DUF3485